MGATELHQPWEGAGAPQEAGRADTSSPHASPKELGLWGGQSRSSKTGRVSPMNGRDFQIKQMR